MKASPPTSVTKSYQNLNCLFIHLAETQKVLAAALVAKGIREFKFISSILSSIFENGAV